MLRKLRQVPEFAKLLESAKECQTNNLNQQNGAPTP